MLSKVRSISKQKLTESALLYLLHCEGKDFEEFNNYFHRYFSHCGGDLREDFDTTNVVFRPFEKLDKLIITGANSLAHLKYSRIKTTDTVDRKRNTYSVKAAYAGKSAYRC